MAIDKRVIWITGSMAAGKSTQRRLLCNTFKTQEPVAHQGIDAGKNFYFTSYGVISCLGKVKADTKGDDVSMCDGLDSVFGTVKKEGGIYSTHKALQLSQVVIIEGSQTSPSWATELQPILKQHKAKLYLVHLYLTYEEAFNRLKERQISKLPPQDQEAITSPLDYTLTDKNIESIIGKCRQFNNCYNKVAGLCERIRIHATARPQEICEDIMAFTFPEFT